jgi:hypothetical protein
MTTTPNPESAPLPTVQEYLDKEFRRTVHNFAARMRQYADNIDRIGNGRLTNLGRPGHIVVAANVLNELHAMMGNNSPWSMLRAAEDAQREADSTQAES